MKLKFGVKELVATAIGAALFFVLGRFVAIPSGIPNTTISIQYGLLGFVSAVFGPVVGLLAGIIGHFFIDFSYGWGVWWSWVITSGVCGLLMGLGMSRVKVAEGEFGKKGIISFAIVAAVTNLISWALVAPVLDILIYAEPADKVFVQGLVSAGANIVTTIVIGLILCCAYVAAIPKKGSLKEEE